MHVTRSLRNRLVACLTMLALLTGIAEFAHASSQRAGCGDADTSGTVTAIDALTVLRRSVGYGATCDICVCDSNGDKRIMASDALLVLQAAVGFSSALACPRCADFGFPESQFCLGTHIVIPSAALPAGLSAEGCALVEQGAQNGCVGTIERTGEGLVIDVRHSEDTYEYCDLYQSIFTCDVSAKQADAMSAAAKVACPCCSIECPERTLCNDVGDHGCASTGAASQAMPKPPMSQRSPTIVSKSNVTATSIVSTTTPSQTVTSSSTESPCGTCCNMDELGDIEIPETPPLFTSLLVRVHGETTPYGCLFCYPSESETDRDIYIGHKDDDSATICIVDAHGLSSSGTIGDCEGYGLLEYGPAEVLHATGINFEPIDTLPAVNFKQH